MSYKKRYIGEEIDLIESLFIPEEKAYDHVPVVFYHIVLHGKDTVVGQIDLRLKMNEYMYYYGHIGYHIDDDYRGHHYALKACRIVKDIAFQVYGIDKLIITCNPDNLASYKTLLQLGCTFIETVDVPKSHELYWKNERKKCIFFLTLNKENTKGGHIETDALMC